MEAAESFELKEELKELLVKYLEVKLKAHSSSELTNDGSIVYCGTSYIQITVKFDDDVVAEHKVFNG